MVFSFLKSVSKFFEGFVKTLVGLGLIDVLIFVLSRSFDAVIFVDCLMRPGFWGKNLGKPMGFTTFFLGEKWFSGVFAHSFLFLYD